MLTSKQRAYLRKISNSYDTIVIVGKGKITDNTVMDVRNALTARELIKGKVLENSLLSPREVADELCDKIGCETVATIGSKFILFKVSDDKDKRKIDITKIK